MFASKRLCTFLEEKKIAYLSYRDDVDTNNMI